MKRLTLIGLLLGITLATSGCPHEDSTVPEPVVKPVSGSEWCEKAEANLLALGCPEGQPTKKGKRFADVCRETQENGIGLNPQCLAGIKSCDVIDKECAWQQSP
jgi:hypothetical protein